MEYKELYEQYKKECPEELRGIEILKARSDAIEVKRHKARTEKLALIEQCKEKLYGREHSQQ